MVATPCGIPAQYCPMYIYVSVDKLKYYYYIFKKVADPFKVERNFFKQLY